MQSLATKLHSIYTISKIMEVMESLDRDTMVKAFKRFRSGTEAVVAANFLKNL